MISDLMSESGLAGVVSKVFPEMCDFTTVMRFVVRVPVLSEQMVVALPENIFHSFKLEIDLNLPIVSQASRWRTRLLSSNIFDTE